MVAVVLMRYFIPHFMSIVRFRLPQSNCLHVWGKRFEQLMREQILAKGKRERHETAKLRAA